MPGAHLHLFKSRGKVAHVIEMESQRHIIANAFTILKTQSELYFPTQNCISEGNYCLNLSTYSL